MVELRKITLSRACHMRITKPSKPRTRDKDKGSDKKSSDKPAYSPISRLSSPRKGR